MIPRGLFITGTDTDVGKTRLATAVIHGLAAAGLGVGVYKPVASGCALDDPRGDARMLWEAAGRPLDLDAVCPQAFAAPIAPAASARAEGRQVDERLLRTGLDRWRTGFDVVVVEGAGGLFSPLGDTTLVIDLAREFGLPVVIVDAARLGAVGRSLAAVRAARAEGVAVAAVVLSHVMPPGDDAGPAAPRSIGAHAASEIAARTALPVTVFDHGAKATRPGIDWLTLASTPRRT